MGTMFKHTSLKNYYFGDLRVNTVLSMSSSPIQLVMYRWLKVYSYKVMWKFCPNFMKKSLSIQWIGLGNDMVQRGGTRKDFYCVIISERNLIMVDHTVIFKKKTWLCFWNFFQGKQINNNNKANFGKVCVLWYRLS